MKISDQMNFASQIINISVFIFFTIKLIQIDGWDITDMLISATTILLGLSVSIIAQIERLRGK